MLSASPPPQRSTSRRTPAALNRLGAVTAVLVLVAGIAGGIAHIGLFFIPALVVLAVGGVKLWREQSWPWREMSDDPLPDQGPHRDPGRPDGTLAAAAVWLDSSSPWAGTGMALQAGGWLSIGAATFSGRPGQTSGALGLLLVGAGTVLLALHKRQLGTPDTGLVLSPGDRINLLVPSPPATATAARDHGATW
jgi:hypothetical protein